MSIEQVLPESSEEFWPQFNEQECRTFVHRPGNMTLLEAALNTKASNKECKYKQQVYKDSRSEITTDSSLMEGWSIEDIRKRQQMFAKVAKTIWPIDQL